MDFVPKTNISVFLAGTTSKGSTLVAADFKVLVLICCSPRPLLKYERALKEVVCVSTSQQEVKDFIWEYENVFNDYEADESRKLLGSSDGATQMRSMLAAQQIYDKSQSVLRSIMDNYSHNKDLYGKRTNLQQMYSDLDKVKTSTLIQSLLATAGTH